MHLSGFIIFYSNLLYPVPIDILLANLSCILRLAINLTYLFYSSSKWIDTFVLKALHQFEFIVLIYQNQKNVNLWGTNTT